MTLAENDFKYVIQDLSHLYIGAKYSYNELIENEEVTFKLKSVIFRYILPETDGDTTLGDHLFQIKERDMAYLIFKQLKAEFKLNVWRDESDGEKKPGYKSRMYRITEIVGNEELQRKRDAIVVEEMRVSKLRLMAVS